jgi:hypothetical protein
MRSIARRSNRPHIGDVNLARVATITGSTGTAGAASATGTGTA